MQRHLDGDWLAPIPAYSRRAFENADARVNRAQSIILDSGCGTGWSTQQLADRFPQALVVGVDRSAVRLARAPRRLAPNACLVRARLEDIWRLAHHARWPVHRHYLLYPNPWPKPRQVMRRWHAHPVFPALLALGGRLELRSNWPVYVEEFRAALALAGIANVEMVSLQDNRAISPFERKFAARGHALFRLTAELERTL